MPHNDVERSINLSVMRGLDARIQAQVPNARSGMAGTSLDKPGHDAGVAVPLFQFIAVSLNAEAGFMHRKFPACHLRQGPRRDVAKRCVT
jgi:hypothetical protein